MKPTLNFRLIIILSLIITIASCKKNSGNNNYSGPGIYVAGMQQAPNAKGQIVYAPYTWKNSSPILLPYDNSDLQFINVLSVFATSNHVYQSGNIATSTGQKPILWDNGNLIYLPATANSYNNYAGAVTVSGNDVYVSGWIGYNAGYWKNSVFTQVDNSGQSGAASIFVSGQDVYLGGSINGNASVWKNNTLTVLSPDSPGIANSVFVSGGDVYACGSISDSVWSQNKIALYWKNGVPVYLTGKTPGTLTSSIYVSGNDVYVAGVMNFAATYWKNGVAVPLANGGFSQANAIIVNNGDVYAAGYDEAQDGRSIATYWKNGAVVHLPTKTDTTSSIAYSIAVRQ